MRPASPASLILRAAEAEDEPGGQSQSDDEGTSPSQPQPHPQPLSPLRAVPAPHPVPLAPVARPVALIGEASPEERESPEHEDLYFANEQRLRLWHAVACLAHLAAALAAIVVLAARRDASWPLRIRSVGRVAMRAEYRLAALVPAPALLGLLRHLVNSQLHMAPLARQISTGANAPRCLESAVSWAAALWMAAALCGVDDLFVLVLVSFIGAVPSLQCLGFERSAAVGAADKGAALVQQPLLVALLLAAWSAILASLLVQHEPAAWDVVLFVFLLFSTQLASALLDRLFLRHKCAALTREYAHIVLGCVAKLSLAAAALSPTMRSGPADTVTRVC
jgi:hypothetical protein